MSTFRRKHENNYTIFCNLTLIFKDFVRALVKTSLKALGFLIFVDLIRENMHRIKNIFWKSHDPNYSHQKCRLYLTPDLYAWSFIICPAGGSETPKLF